MRSIVVGNMFSSLCSKLLIDSQFLKLYIHCDFEWQTSNGNKINTESATRVAGDQQPFLPEASFGLRVLSLPACVCVCVCVCLSVNHQLVRAVTHQPFKLESPNLDQRCKRPWLRSLLFFGMIDLELQSQIELKSQNLPHFELVRAISHHKLKSVFPNFGQKCILALLRSLLILGWIDLDVLFYF